MTSLGEPDPLRSLLDWPGTAINVEIHVVDLDVVDLETERRRLRASSRDPYPDESVEAYIANRDRWIDQRLEPLRCLLEQPIRHVDRVRTEVEITNHDEPVYGGYGLACWSPGPMIAVVRLWYEVRR